MTKSPTNDKPAKSDLEKAGDTIRNNRDRVKGQLGDYPQASGQPQTARVKSDIS